jgi:hypothetical protein
MFAGRLASPGSGVAEIGRAAAAAPTGETQAIKEATGSNLAPYGALGLAALRGDEAGTLVTSTAA